MVSKFKKKSNSLRFPIKVLHFINGLDIGGAEMILSDLTTCLNPKYYQVIVVSILPPGQIGKKIKNSGIPLYTLNIRSKFTPLIIPRLINIIQKEKPVILHCHLFHANILGRIIGKLLNVPIIISSIYSESLEGRMKEKLIKFTNFCSDQIVINSQLAAEKLIKKRIVPFQKVKVIYGGIDIKKFQSSTLIKTKEKIYQEFSFEKNQQIVLSVGHLEEVKGYSFLIESISILKRKYPKLVCLIIGKGKLEKSLKEQVANKRLTNSIYFPGVREDIFNFLASSDLFILPSLYEGIPVALLEAMTVGLPVVATKVGGVSEVVIEGKTGFLASPKNSVELARKIDYVLSLSLTERKKIANAGEERIKRYFSIQQTSKEIEQLYQELLNQKGLIEY